MEQFHKKGETNLSNLQRNGKKKESDQDQLQRLWEKLQDLSEVQDESRNQQMPAFIDDNSVMSRHEQNDSFFNTVKILNDHSDEPQNLLGYLNCANSNDYAKLPENCQDFYDYQDKAVNQDVYETQKHSEDSKFTGHYNNSNQIYFQKKQPYILSGRNDDISHHLPPNMSFDSKKLEQTLNSTKTIMSRGHPKPQNSQKQDEILETNKKLTEDNRKLFEECIKLRKQLMLLSMSNTNQNNRQVESVPQLQKEVNHSQPIIKSQTQEIYKLQRKNHQLTQKINQLQQKLTQCEERQQQNERFLNQRQLFQQQQIKITRRKIQKEFETKYSSRILQLEGVVYLKEKQLLNLKEECINLKNQVMLMEVESQNEKKENQQLIHSNWGNSLSSIKTNTLPPNKKINNHHNCNIHQNLICDPNSSRITQLETIIRDKERQISNMKVVHESDQKKMKATIKMLEEKLRSIT